MAGLVRWVGVVAAAICLSTTVPASAQRQPPGYNTEKLTTVEIADQTEVTTALADLNKGGYPALERHLAPLLTVVSHAPASYPKVETRGELVLVRADPPELGALSLIALSQALRVQPGSSLKAVQAMNIYPVAYLLLAMSANESLRHDQALKYTEQGLALQDDFIPLLPERGIAFSRTKRPAEALATYDRGLKAELPMADHMKAILLRGRGYALIELKRLDEAQKAYEDSLKIEPGNPLATNELQFIANAKKARPQS